ncbi:hypothetical protein L1987_35565 [Smallanthus sonchifolius]|uniref:Uncharacterized protein n=1 Tax=Smallanthus sonchifolius TaxID=185202 RepID=A0ACB9HAP6_9ASTR|nr:hypothetical protein L1987_35565 [Smallanthus sonchifolius]
MGKHGGDKKKTVPLQPIRQQPQRSTRMVATGGNMPKDSSRGWNPFAHSVPPSDPVNQVCSFNKSASTIPTVSLCSTGGIGLPVSSSGSNSSSVQSSPVNPLVWADVVKGLHSGLKSGLNTGLNSGLKSPVNSPIVKNLVVSDVLPTPLMVTGSAGASMVVGDPIAGIPESIPVVSPCLTSAPDEAHVAVTADGTDACKVNPNGLSALGPDAVVSGPCEVGPSATGLNSDSSAGPEGMHGSGGPNFSRPDSSKLSSSGPSANVPIGLDALNSSNGFNFSGPDSTGLSSTGSLGINSGHILSVPEASKLDQAKVGPDEAFGLGPQSGPVGVAPAGPAASPTGRVFGPHSGLHSPACDPVLSTRPDALCFSTRSLQFGSMSPTKVHDDLVFACDKNVASIAVPKEPNTGGPNGMRSEVVDLVSVGPVSVGPKDVGLVDVPSEVVPLPVPKGNMRDKGKIPISNQFDSLGGPVLDDFDDFFDGVTGLWESERQTAHYYIEYGLKPPDFVFEKWSPKLQVYYSQLTKVEDPGGPSTVIADVEDDEVASEADASARFMTMS